MSYRPLFAVAAVVACAVSACAPMPSGVGYYGPATSATFSAEDFTWSTRQGQASIEGRVDYAPGGQAHSCVGSVGLTPDTPYTRARIATLYGSNDRAAIPAAVVRARTVDDASADYRGYVRSATCDGNRFRFSGLPDGSWYVIAPVRAGSSAPIVLMRRIQTRGGRIANVLL